MVAILYNNACVMPSNSLFGRLTVYQIVVHYILHGSILELLSENGFNGPLCIIMKSMF